MNDSFGGGFTQGEKGPDSKNEGIISLVVKQIKGATEEGVNMYGMNYRLVKTVALVRNIDHSSTKITYKLEDYTGQIDGYFWLDEDLKTIENPQVMLNTYAEVIGSVRTTGGVKHIMIFKIRPITTINELNTHLLEVVAMRYVSEDYSKKGAGAVSYGNEQTNAPSNDYQSALENNGLKGKPLAIFNAIRDCKTEVGINRFELKQKFKNFTETELGNILDLLNNEGHIYTSIDADHFLAVNTD